MSRLIDADALIKVLATYKFGAIQNEVEREYIKETVINFVKDAPTAYDPEAVVAKLEEYKDSHLVEHDSERYEHCKGEEINCDGRDCFLCVWDKAIEIVRKGGV